MTDDRTNGAPAPGDGHGARRPAVVLANLGTPSAPTPSHVRRFLREFLSDRRVVETHPLLWRPVLEGVVLRVRPRVVAKKYAGIWTPQGSPLMRYTLRQAELLGRRMPDVDVQAAMRYGEPGLGAVLDALHARGTRRVAVLPAYPQYSATTVASLNDVAAQWLRRNRDGFDLRLVRSFPTAPAYIDALASALESHWGRCGRPDFAAGDAVVVSFHSIPEAMDRAGDPYRSECMGTVAALEARLGLARGALTVAFQSVFGPAAWLGPATIDTVTRLGARGCARLDVICPGFMADCLETLEEIDQLNREAFTRAGGSGFHYVPWGNDSEGAVSALAEQARTAVAGWV
ncbi:ferrochelatase [Pauljensenia hongkongensis]|uniref:Coproporphyrin III ferrochelatase n=1 Tax=Pauljensenia hongkongensis TaxID=178339 RepID=A0A1D8B3Q2_9ACTO|nr:ferrochelatase [Pauljensenia hongkongensis]AOS47762.1 ferrochelatase [Pauljensenia hongkongensis]RKV64851.1 MAG: ferrochelatase [Actinomyces sp.]WLD80387.1 ferrochelatase [Schaalia sp. HMT-877]